MNRVLEKAWTKIVHLAKVKLQIILLNSNKTIITLENNTNLMKKNDKTHSVTLILNAYA